MAPLMGPLRAILALLLTAAAAPALAAVPVPPGLAAQAAEEGRVRVIVRLDAPVATPWASAEQRGQARQAIRRAANAALDRVGNPSRPDLRRFGALPLLALELGPGELAALADADEVLSIEPDRPGFPSLSVSTPFVNADVTTAAGFDGSGTAIVIIDTGVEAGHSFFQGRVVEEACFSSGRDCPNGQTTQYGAGAAAPCTYGALCWHGTHVAGIAAGSSVNADGVTPGASLIAIQAGSEMNGPGCGSAGSPCVTIFASDAIAGIDYVVDTLSASYDVAAINMSFGSESTWSSESSCDGANSGYRAAIDSARAIGIPSVAASGNDEVSTGITAPACISSAIGVGATSKFSQAIASLSNTGPPLDLVAPGLGITSSVPGGGFANGSGTSMAAPHVAGALAALRQADAAASVSDLLAALDTTGIPLKDPDNGLYFPLIQVDDAVRARAPARCFDGLDNDSDGFVDVDGDGGAPDPHCVSGLDGSEATPSSCGVGPELALVLPLLGALRLTRRGRNRAR
jgi:subtilisin family serine protease